MSYISQNFVLMHHCHPVTALDSEDAQYLLTSTGKQRLCPNFRLCILPSAPPQSLKGTPKEAAFKGHTYICQNVTVYPLQ